MEIMERLLGLVAVVLSGTTLLFNIISIAIPSWIHASKEIQNGFRYLTYSYKMGLWEYCLTSDFGETCSTFLKASDFIKATRAMEILGMLLILVAIACATLKLFFMTDQERFPKIAGATAVASGVFMLLGAIIFGSKFKLLYVPPLAVGLQPALHAGFGLAIVAGVLGIAAGVSFFVAHNKNQI